MIRCASVFTYEMDNQAIALEEIRSQLDEKVTLLENSVGIIMCHPEFIYSGMVKHLGENLPFDLVGVTTASQAVNGAAGEMMLTIFVITSDDVQFRTGATEDVSEDIGGPTQAAFQQSTVGISEAPKLALVFPPFILGCAGDAYLRAWGEIAPNTPVFGTLAVDDSVNFEGRETIYNGMSYKTAMSFVLFYGNVNPRFLVASLPESCSILGKGEVTKSEGPYVHEINHVNAYQYFAGLDFIRDINALDNLLLVPIKLDLIKREDYDGIPVVRGHGSFTEDGTAIFHGDVDEGSTFSLLSINLDDVLHTTLSGIEQINALPDVNGVLLFSCIVRRMVLLGINPLLELESVKNKLSARIPFMMGYAGGEICPTSVRDGIPTNRYHNYTLVMLVI